MSFDHNELVKTLRSKNMSQGKHINYLEYIKGTDNSNSGDSNFSLNAYTKIENMLNELFLNYDYSIDFDDKEAQDLTRKFDDKYSLLIKLALIGEALNNELMPDNPLKICYIYLTYFRRNEMFNEFLLFYDLLEDKAKGSKFLRPFRHYYFLYNYREKLICEGSKGNNYRFAFELLTEKNIKRYDGVEIENTIIKNKDFNLDVTLCNFVIEILKANIDKFYGSKRTEYLEFYGNALESIEKIAIENQYALYYSILAEFQLLGLKLNIKSFDYKLIKKNIQTAIDLENTTESGLRKNNKYLSQLSELNHYEIAELQKILKNEVAVIERKSLKKFSAYCAFISFAVGLIASFVSGNKFARNFNEIIGFFFILFGIAVLIFFILDIVIVESLFPEEKGDTDNQNIERKIERSLLKNKIIRGTFELIIGVIFVVGGCLIGLLL